ncbi:MAG TPA: hypothetical protein VGH33_20520, partial [Isosphaeraceae bacterium]
VRFTVRRLMFAAAIAALVFAWAVARPYPTVAFASAAWYIEWSDGTMTMEYGPNMMTFRGTSWLSIVDFPDGRTRYYLTVRPARIPWPRVLPDPPE